MARYCAYYCNCRYFFGLLLLAVLKPLFEIMGIAKVMCLHLVAFNFHMLLTIPIAFSSFSMKLSFRTKYMCLFN